MDELHSFALDFFREEGALIERPAFGIADILLPDALAAQLGIAPFLRLAVDEEAAAQDDARRLAFGDPLVERMIALARTRGQVAQWFVNNVRLEKHDLESLIQREATFANAWLTLDPSATAAPLAHHYVRFNFKVILLSDEKEEQIASVLMDAQRGTPAWEFEKLENSGNVMLEPTQRFRDISEAPLLWRNQTSEVLQVFNADALAQLQQRAADALEEKLGALLVPLRQRTAHRLELDLARLNEFFDETEKDYERRLARTAGDARRVSLESKLVAARAQREAKLADVREKYRLRVVLELINLALIVQPKIHLEVRVENRYAAAPITFVYDPLLHQLETPLCAVCKRAHTPLHLCANGHLVGEECIRKCGVCKREYCKMCDQDFAMCAVCSRVLCIKSQVRCAVCGKITCDEHRAHAH
jgi:hypothetical protein